MKSRRTFLQGLAIAAPAAWTRPLVESVVLPAHATTTGCGDCYPYDFGSVEWIPGNPGIVNFYSTSDCSGSPGYSSPGVEAATEEEATSIVECNPGDGIYVQEAITGCTVWYCDA